ncbi:MAG: SRPBCC domain-containing protein [Acidimicrobiia bacterium]
MTANAQDVKVFRVYIRTTPERLWEAITDPGWNNKYGYQAVQEFELKKGGKYRGLATAEMREYGGVPEVIIEGEVLEATPPTRLVQTYRMLFTPEMGAEPFTTLTYDIHAEHPDLCRLTITHDVTGAPIHGATVFNDGGLTDGGGGWAWILSDLKTFLESGASLQG